jgi:hypothetical protein
VRTRGDRDLKYRKETQACSEDHKIKGGSGKEKKKGVWCPE